MAHNNSGARETFATRLGFIMVSAGCAVGLGNVWRFPYICGQYGGGAFVLMYLVFLVIIGWPILCMEFTVGRGSRRGIARSFDELQPKGGKWHRFKWAALAGNYLLMMFYTTVAGWMLAYAAKSISGQLSGLTPDQVGATFGTMLGNPLEMFAFMAIIVVCGIAVCAFGIQRGVERVTKVMMTLLLGVMVIMIVRAATLPGAAEGLAFYLIPDFEKLFGSGLIATWDAVFAAMAHAFFTLSLGIGSMSVFGSYLSKERSIAGEAMRVAGLDTLVAIMAGLIIFPTCFAFGVQPDSGPGLVFITLPNVFEQMPLGQVWCSLFFLFMSAAALSTVIAVFENIMTFSIDQWGMDRRKACAINGVALFLLSLPCLLGFNVLSGVTFPGIGDIQSIEDFIVSNNLLPLGGMVFLLFCTRKKGWGFDAFLAEVDTGQGMRFPRFLRGYLTYVLPVIIAVVFVGGWLPVIQKWIALATGAG